MRGFPYSRLEHSVWDGRSGSYVVPGLIGTHLVMNELLSKQDLETLLGLGKAAVTTLTQRADFPRAIRINSRTLRWDQQEIADWIRLAKTSNQTPKVAQRSRNRSRRSYVVDGIEFSEVKR